MRFELGCESLFQLLFFLGEAKAKQENFETRELDTDFRFLCAAAALAEMKTK